MVSRIDPAAKTHVSRFDRICAPTGAGSLHLREAGEADQHCYGFAGAHLNVKAVAAVGVSLRQRRDDVSTGAQEKLKLPVRVGDDGAAGARDGIPGGRTLRKREAGMRERAPGVAARRSLAPQPPQIPAKFRPSGFAVERAPTLLQQDGGDCKRCGHISPPPAEGEAEEQCE